MWLDGDKRAVPLKSDLSSKRPPKKMSRIKSGLAGRSSQSANGKPEANEACDANAPGCHSRKISDFNVYTLMS